MLIINGSGEIANYTLSIMGWFSIAFPAKMYTCRTITSHSLEACKAAGVLMVSSCTLQLVCFASFRFLEEYKIRWTIHGTNTHIELNLVAWSVFLHRWPI